jgi:periplasmic protein TonB
MYGTIKHSGARARTFGLATAGVLTAAAFYGLNSGLIREVLPFIEPATEIVLLDAEKPIEVEDLPEPEVEVEAPPPQLVAPPLPDFITPPPDPVIIAPPAPPEPPPAATAPTPPAPPKPAVPDARPKLLASGKPDYPSASVRAGEEGVTRLEVCVTAQGRVQSASVTTSSGHPRLDDAAAKWVRNSRFQPAIVSGSPTSVCGHKVAYEWDLQDARG